MLNSILDSVIPSRSYGMQRLVRRMTSSGRVPPRGRLHIRVAGYNHRLLVLWDRGDFVRVAAKRDGQEAGKCLRFGASQFSGRSAQRVFWDLRNCLSSVELRVGERCVKRWPDFETFLAWTHGE